MGKIFGHKFEARYDVVSKLNPENQPSDHIILALGDEALELCKDYTSTYKGDVCRRCGKIINNKE